MPQENQINLLSIIGKQTVELEVLREALQKLQAEIKELKEKK